MIRAEQLTFNIGDFTLRQFDLEVESGKYFVLLGPPGSGKTIFLECLCGLKTIESGRIILDDKDVTELEPRSRGIGYVPQDYALFPHLSVAENIEFGLKVARLPRDTITSRVAATAGLLDIANLLNRRIAGLSGGEKQRTALARAIVMEPRLLLLDEPVCALDEGTRQRICALLHKIQRKLSLTVIHVSHSIEEAFSVADHAAILHNGELQQVGPLQQLLRKPKNEFIARFMRCENIFDACAVLSTSDESRTEITVAGVQLSASDRHSGNCKVMMRPENITLHRSDCSAANLENALAMTVVGWRDYGGYVKVELRGAVEFIAHITHAAFAQIDPKPGSTVLAAVGADNIHILA